MTLSSNGRLRCRSTPLRRIARLALFAGSLLIAGGLQAQPTSLRLSSPNGGEDAVVGTTLNIRWSSNGLVDTLLYIEYSVDSGTVWKFIDTARAVNGFDTLAWTVPDDTTSNAFVRVRLADSSRIGRSARRFNIVTTLPPRITVISPNGGQIFGRDSVVNIRWSSQAITGTLHIEYSADSGQSWKPIGTKQARTGLDTLSWTIPDDTTSNAYVRVRTADGVTSDRSNFTFRIVSTYKPSVKLIYPNGGEVFAPDSAVIIVWEEQDLTGNIRVELSVDSGGTWILIGQHTAMNGTDTLQWTVPNDSTDGALIRVGTQGFGPGTAIRDTSNAFFRITAAPPPPPASISDVGPNGGIYAPDSVIQIYWTAANVVSVLHVEYSLDSGSTWNQIALIPGRDGPDSTSWTVPRDSTHTGFFRVHTQDSSVVSMSTAPFVIRVPQTGAGVDPTIAPQSLRLVSAAPIPASDRVRITWEQKSAARVVIRLYDSEGDMVVRTDVPTSEEGTSSRSLDLSGLSPGLYVAMISAAGDVLTTTIVVAR